jgi:hypothetical protein
VSWVGFACWSRQRAGDHSRLSPLAPFLPPQHLIHLQISLFTAVAFLVFYHFFSHLPPHLLSTCHSPPLLSVFSAFSLSNSDTPTDCRLLPAVFHSPRHWFTHAVSVQTEMNLKRDRCLGITINPLCHLPFRFYILDGLTVNLPFIRLLCVFNSALVVGPTVVWQG